MLPGRLGGRRRYRDPYAPGLIDFGSLVGYWDAGNISCWDGGSQIFKNAQTAPADGAAQSAYDLRRGDGSTSSTYPTFNGTPGNKSSSEYFSFDGGDYLDLYGGNTALVKGLHKDNANFSMVAGVRFGSFASSMQGIFSTQGTGGSNQGFGFYASQTTANLTIAAGTGGGSALNKTSTDTYSTGTNYLVGLSLNENGNGFFYKNGGYDQVSASDTWAATYTGPTASDPFGHLTLGAKPDVSSLMANGARVYFAFLYNTALTKIQMDSIWTIWRNRLGI